MKRINWLSFFVCVLLLFSIVALLFLYFDTSTIKSETEAIKNQIITLEKSVSGEELPSSDNTIIDFYRELNDKTDDAIEKIFSAVAVVTAILTFFSMLLAFKAPYDIDRRIDELKIDIDRRIDELKIEIDKQRETNQKSEYNYEIVTALSKTTPFERQKELTNVIKKYPDNSDAYMLRGFEYDNLKLYDNAISDYQSALKRGADKSSYFNSMGVAYSNKSQHELALDQFTKAIELDSDDAELYCNRGNEYGSLEDFGNALLNYNEAIKIDPECFNAYINRSITYKQMMIKESDIEKSEEYERYRLEDLRQATKLNPHDKKAQALLREALRDNGEEADLAQIQEVMIANIDEKIGDLEHEDKNIVEALKHYQEAISRYSQQSANEKFNILEKIIHIINKIARILLVEKADNVDSKQIDGLIDSIISALKQHAIGNLPDTMFDVTIIPLSQWAFDRYIKRDYLNAQKLYEIVYEIDADDRRGASINLAYILRRGETPIMSAFTAKDCLEHSSQKASVLWGVNRALLEINNNSDTEEWYRAISIVRNTTEGAKAAFDWWKDENRVGKKESNLAILLLRLAGKCNEEDVKSLDSRLAQAKEDGYNVPRIEKSDDTATPIV